MQQFTYTITEPVGIHARPAGLLAKAVKALDSYVTITNPEGVTRDASKLMPLLSLGIECGDTVTVTLLGETESDDAVTLAAYFREHL